MSTWTINGKTLPELNASNLKRALVNQGIDKLSFDMQVDDMTADLAISYGLSYGSNVVLKKDDDIWFTGRCLTIPRSASIGDETISIEAAGPWWWFERIVYAQRWMMYDATADDVIKTYKSRVVLCLDENGARITSGAQITDCVNYAISKGAPIALGTIDPAINLPWDENTDILIAEVIIKMLRYSPDCVAYFDYSTEVPTFNVRSRANMTAVSASITAGETLSQITITPRNDLTLPGVLVAFEKTHDDNGTTYDTVEVQTAGEYNHIEALRSTIKLSGQAVSTTAQKIVVEAKPTTTAGWKTWLIANDPWCAALPVADWTLDSADDTGHLYNNILIEGEVKDWVGNAVSIGCAFVVSYLLKDADDLVIRTEKTTIRRVITFTDCTSRTYRHLESFDAEEATPAGLATSLYNARSVVPYDGSFEVEEEECTGTYVPGRKFNLTGGRTEWTAMNTLIQSITEDIESGTTSINFGSPAQLGPDDLLYLLRAFRTRRPSYKYQERDDGVSGQGASSQVTSGGVNRQNLNAGPPPGEKRQEKIRSADGTKEIDLDPILMEYTPESPSPLLGDASTTVMKPREISLCINGVIQKAFFLCTEFTT